MRQIASVLLLVAAAVPIGAKWKIKDKHFDPVRITDVRQAAGRYVGIDPDYVVDVRVADDGTISGTVTQFGVVSPLRELRIDDAELNATVGGLPFHGTFVKRTKNGEVGFGLLVHDADIKLDGDIRLDEIFCGRHPE